jgi:hypothetical protein
MRVLERISAAAGLAAVSLGDLDNGSHSLALVAVAVVEEHHAAGPNRQ